MHRFAPSNRKKLNKRRKALDLYLSSTIIIGGHSNLTQQKC